MNYQKFEMPDFPSTESPTRRLPDFPSTESPTRRLLEQTRLSQLPPPPRPAVCEHCKSRLDPNDEYQAKVKVCRQCLRTAANVGLILEKYTTEKLRRNYAEAK